MGSRVLIVENFLEKTKVVPEKIEVRELYDKFMECTLVSLKSRQRFTFQCFVLCLSAACRKRHVDVLNKKFYDGYRVKPRISVNAVRVPMRVGAEIMRAPVHVSVR